MLLEALELIPSSKWQPEYDYIQSKILNKKREKAQNRKTW
jgi:hypothetical protein